MQNSSDETMDHPLEIKHLADCPEVVATASRWLFHEWGQRTPGSSLERSITRVQRRATKDSIPFALVAFSDGRPVGIASVVEVEDPGDTVGPWVSGVYVEAAYRGLGIATRLVQRVEAEAKRLGVRELVLSAAAPALYEALGYQPTGAEKNGEPIMRKVLA